MPLRLEPRHDATNWYELWSGRVLVGLLRFEDPGWRAGFWTFNITIFHEKITGVETIGGGKDKDSCWRHAQECWAAQLEALGLREDLR